VFDPRAYSLYTSGASHQDQTFHACLAQLINANAERLNLGFFSQVNALIAGARLRQKIPQWRRI
jgi:hypothetical protein